MCKPEYKKSSWIIDWKQNVTEEPFICFTKWNSHDAAEVRRSCLGAASLFLLSCLPACSRVPASPQVVVPLPLDPLHLQDVPSRDAHVREQCTHCGTFITKGVISFSALRTVPHQAFSIIVCALAWWTLKQVSTPPPSPGLRYGGYEVDWCSQYPQSHRMKLPAGG